MEITKNEDIPRKIEKTIYSVEITNGYVFRQIFELYDKLIIEGIPVYFKESGITIRSGTSSTKDCRKLISDIEIFTDDVIEYYLDKDLCSIKEDENKPACYIEELNINTVKSVFKSIAKSNSVRIYKTTMSDDVSIEIKGLTTEHSRLSTSKYHKIHYDVSQYQPEEEIDPNLKIEISQFCTTMKGMTRGDAEYTSFKVYPSGLKIEGRNGTGSITKDMCWGLTPETCEGTEDKFFETKVNSFAIKALTKISGMSNYSIIKIMSYKNGLLNLNHKIGDFGEHNIYLIDNS